MKKESARGITGICRAILHQNSCNPWDKETLFYVYFVFFAEPGLFLSTPRIHQSAIASTRLHKQTEVAVHNLDLKVLSHEK